MLPNKITLKDKIDVLYNDVLYTQSVCKHLMGRCPEKNTPIKTTKQFINECKEIWGDKYDYSLVQYIGSLKPIKIIYDGVIFEQIASSHINGLKPELNMNRDWFIKRSKDKWGDKYDYSLVEYTNCKSKVKIIYKKTGEIYEQTPEGHLKNAPENIHLSIRRTTEKFIEESIKIHKDKYDYSLVNYYTNNIKVDIICKKHGIFSQVPQSHLIGNGCKKCGFENSSREHKPKYTTAEFINEAKIIWGDKYDYSLVDYKNCKTKIKIIFDGIIYEQTPISHFKYPPERFLNQEIFLIKAKRKWGDKYDYSLTNFIDSRKTIKIKFNNEIYEQLPCNHLNYAPELRNTKSQDEFINESKKIHNNKYNYDDVIYSNIATQVTINCPKHGKFKQKPYNHLKGSGCKKCSESFGEKTISNFLDINNIQYIREHKFDDCKYIQLLKFDFYIPSFRTCIEFDGIQHFTPIEYFGGIKAYESLVIRDKIKEQYCEDNYINLIRIKYDKIDNIEEILKENLKVLLELKNTNL